MKFSVLIPVYNTEKYLEECLQSVFNQTYKDYEIILVDDGSTDSSADICDRYQSEYPEVVKVIHQENQGQLLSRCNAIKVAQGDYCIFMDADDLIVEDALEILNKTIGGYNTPDMVTYPFYYDRGGKLEKSKVISDTAKFFNKGDKGLRELFFTGVLLNSMWTKCVKSTVLKKSINNTEKFAGLRCSEDRLQSMWILDETKTSVYINIPLYIYRLFLGSTTRQYSLDTISKFNDVLLYEEQINYAKKWGLFSETWQSQFQANLVNHLVYVFDLFYMNVERSDRDAVLYYEWRTFLPDEFDINSVEHNVFINDIRKKLFYMIVNQDISQIKRYYMKKRLYKRVKKFKNNILSK